MKTIGITGSTGFLGWHLRAALHPKQSEFTVVQDTRDMYGDNTKLDTFVQQCDVIVHLAGMNRGADAAIYDTNISLTKALIDACDRTGAKPQILFSSSTHVERDTAYGRSKRDAAALLRAWADKQGAVFTNLIMPNIFGEYGKPHYNSAIATLCYQITRDEQSTVTRDANIELIHAQDVAQKCIAFIQVPENRDVRIEGTKVVLHEVYEKLVQFKTQYFNNIIPEFASRFDVQLFNTLRSFLPETHFPRALELKTDNRGSLFEMIKGNARGQFFVSTTKPGITRGNHYHTRKIERFCVIEGKAEIKIRKILTNEVQTYQVDGSNPVYVDMPTLCTHNITNTGTETLHTLFWINEVFNPDDTDTFADVV
jgi:UDP-2-acetamido-2,6-beta-L-arabino-hexul-4-ose reductase